MSMLGLPNLEAMDNLVTRMEKVAESMDESARRTEVAAKLMLQAAKLNQSKEH